MTGRIRTIKPEIRTDALTASLTHEGWRLFTCMITMADDYGNLPADPDVLDGAVFAKQPSEQGVQMVLAELASNRKIPPLNEEAGPLIDVYMNKGQLYAHLRGWNEHQRVDRPGKPRCPGPNDSGSKRLELAYEAKTPCRKPRSRVSRDSVASVSRDSREFSRDPRESLATDLRPPTSDLRSGTPTSDPEGDHDHRTVELAPPVADASPPLMAAERVSSADIDQVVDRYKQHHPRARPGAEERKLIAKRLKEGYSPEDLCRAIDGCHASPFHCGQNDRGQIYQSLELIVRDSKHVAEFIELYERGPPPAAPERSQRNARVVGEWLMKRARTPEKTGGPENA